MTVRRRNSHSLYSLYSLPQPATACPQDAVTPSLDCENTSYPSFFSFFDVIFCDISFFGRHFAIYFPNSANIFGKRRPFHKKTGKNVQKDPQIPQIPQPAAACRSLPQPANVR